MRNKRWLRLGLGSLGIAGGALGAFLVACGDDDNGSSGGPPDTGADNVTPDVQNDTTTQPEAGIPAKITAVNAVLDMGPNNPVGGLRVCFGIGASPDAAPPTAVLPPLPDRSPVPGIPPAIYIGTGGAFSGTGAPLGQFYLVPYLMNSTSLALKGVLPPGNGTPGKTCATLLGPTPGVDGGIVENVDYWKLPPLPPGTLADGSSKLLLLTGCTSDSAANPGFCGPGFVPTGAPGLGNLEIHVYDLSRATVAATSFGAQFVNGSSAANALAAGIGGVQPGLSQPDAGNFRPFTGGPDASVALYGQTNLLQIPNVDINNDSLILSPLVVQSAVSLKLTEAISFAATGGDAGTQAYQNGKPFTFISVGDVTEPLTEDGGPGGRFNTKTFHYLGFPNDPIVSTYTPP